MKITKKSKKNKFQVNATLKYNQIMMGFLKLDKVNVSQKYKTMKNN